MQRLINRAAQCLDETADLPALMGSKIKTLTFYPVKNGTQRSAADKKQKIKMLSVGLRALSAGGDAEHYCLSAENG
jgi:hypothetical protein